MLRAEDNRFLTESGAGTAMGELLRRFWLPVLLSEELPEPDGKSPLRAMTHEERLVADFHGTGLTIGPHPMTFHLELTNRRALVTGGTKGIGAAVVAALVDAGAPGADRG